MGQHHQRDQRVPYAPKEGREPWGSGESGGRGKQRRGGGGGGSRGPGEGIREGGEGGRARMEEVGERENWGQTVMTRGREEGKKGAGRKEQAEGGMGAEVYRDGVSKERKRRQ